MRRIVIITAALLVSALGAQAASRHPAHRQAASSACMARQAHIADIIEQNGATSLPAFQQLAKDLRTRCLPQDHNPADYDPFNPFYVDPHANDTP